MRSFFTLAAAAAALLPLVAAVPEAGTVQLDFQKRKADAGTGRLGRRQSKTVNAQITNEQILYLINVTVGTPPQSIGLQLDTGSSDIWFPSVNAANCRRGRCLVGSYNADASSTYRDPNLGQFSISYVDGTQVSGQYIRDTLSVGGTTVTNLTMADATSIGQQLYGIMGVGFPADESSDTGANGFIYPNIIDVLLSQGKINTRSYSLWLDDIDSNTGSILFGGVDKDKYTGNLVSIPIQKDSDSGTYSSFSVAWTGLTITGGGQTSTQNPSTPQAAILDSGTTLLYLPTNIVSNIYNGLGVVTDREYGNLIPCDYANDDLNFSFQFGGSNGPKIVVPLSEFVVPLVLSSGRQPKFSSGTYKGRTACNIGIEDAGSNPILFGDTFLRSAYVVYDLDNLQIGLAQTNRNGNAGTGNVQAFSSGGGMPDATATVTGVTVAASTQGGPIIQTSATATGDAGSQATTRTATFSLVATGSGSSSSSGAASPVTIPSIQKSTIAVIAVTIASFLVGTTLL